MAGELLADWDSALERFVKVMPNDYRRVLDARERGGPPRPRRGLMGELGAFLRIERSPARERDPAERAHDYHEFTLHRPSPSSRSRARGAWSAGSRSATAAAHSGT